MKTTIVMDLDGTLFDATHRQHHAQAGEWHEFHGACSLDKPFEDTLALAHMAPRQGYGLIYLTGRNDMYRSVTLNKLMKHDCPIGPLLMRPDKNFESDVIVKPRLLGQYFGSIKRATESVLCILEDRQAMTDEWRRLGFRCWQVQEGAY